MNVETIRPNQSPEYIGDPRDPEGLARSRVAYLTEAEKIAEEAASETIAQAPGTDKPDIPEALAA